MTNKEKIERFIKSEIFFLEDLDDAYPPKYDGDIKQWLARGLSDYWVELCETGGRYYVGTGDCHESWDEIATSMAEDVGKAGLIDNIIAYMDLVLENEKPKIEISYDLENLNYGDCVVFRTLYQDPDIQRYEKYVKSPEDKANFVHYFKDKEYVILKNLYSLLVKS